MNVGLDGDLLIGVRYVFDFGGGAVDVLVGVSGIDVD